MSYAFQSFVPHFKALATVGFYELVPASDSPLRASLHNMFRILVAVLVVLDNIQHAIYLLTVLGDTSKMATCLFMLLSTMNCVVKYSTINMRRNRIQGLLDIINGPYFQPTDRYHIQVLDRNSRSMHRMLRLFTMNVLLCCALYSTFPIVDRLMGETVEFSAWIPFDTQKSPIFELVLLHLVVTITIQAYGHTIIDCLIVALYSQATAQIKILRHNYENIVQDAENIVKDHEKQSMQQHAAPKYQLEDQNVTKDPVSKSGILQGTNLGPEVFTKYRYDKQIQVNTNKKLQHILIKRFIFCVQHYQTIVSYIQEVQDIFNISLTSQFIVAAWVICMTVYNIAEMETYLTVEFAFMFTYLLIMLVQLFLYCYHGTELTFESELLNQSIFGSDWTRTSTKFRRLLLIQMTRCARPIEPTVAFIIPLSLDSFMAVVKFSYTLFTVLRQE